MDVFAPVFPVRTYGSKYAAFSEKWFCICFCISIYANTRANTDGGGGNTGVVLAGVLIQEQIQMVGEVIHAPVLAGVLIQEQIHNKKGKTRAANSGKLSPTPHSFSVSSHPTTTIPVVHNPDLDIGW